MRPPGRRSPNDSMLMADADLMADAEVMADAKMIRIFEDLDTEIEERCYSIITNEKSRLSVNPHPLNREDILCCKGEILDDFEESLNDHEKLIEMLEDQENFCKLHSDHGAVKTFRCLTMDQEVSLSQLEYKLTEGMQINGGIMEQGKHDL